MNHTIVNTLLENTTIRVHGFHEHSKASEQYVEVSFLDDNGNIQWTGFVPYYYRRTGLFISTEVELSEYLQSIVHYFEPDRMRSWVEQERGVWDNNLQSRDVTIGFFHALLTMEWTSNFPANRNPQRRIQDIKELGYTIATRRSGREVSRLLLPIPRAEATGYERISPRLKNRIISILRAVNSYELSSANKAGLLPDHKFPEIRWDVTTRQESIEEMTDDDIQRKFQLIDNQRNQQKREVCRSCYQTNKRGIIFGIKYFYEGGEDWDSTISKTGSDAERGCVGCGWYDIQQWRTKLNERLGS